jgi:hypothetical protein
VKPATLLAILFSSSFVLFFHTYKEVYLGELLVPFLVLGAYFCKNEMCRLLRVFSQLCSASVVYTFTINCVCWRVPSAECNATVIFELKSSVSQARGRNLLQHLQTPPKMKLALQFRPLFSSTVSIKLPFQAKVMATSSEKDMDRQQKIHVGYDKVLNSTTMLYWSRSIGFGKNSD